MFYQTLLNSSSVVGGGGLLLNLINLGIQSKNSSFYPQNFFYKFEYNMADCGGLTLSNQNKNYQAYAFAFGLK